MNQAVFLVTTIASPDHLTAKTPPKKRERERESPNSPIFPRNIVFFPKFILVNDVFYCLL